MESFDSWFKAIRTGNINSASLILKNNPDFLNKYKIVTDDAYKYKTNAIIEAAYQGNRDLIKWLIENNADVNAISDKAWRPIHFAAQQGHVTTVNLLINAGADVDAETENNETPILLALHSYMRDTVKRLLHHGASIVGIDRHFLQNCIKKDILDLYSLSDKNYNYLQNYSSASVTDSGYSVKSDSSNRNKPIRGVVNTAQITLLTNSSVSKSSGTDQNNFLKKEPEIKIVKLTRPKLQTEYDNELKRRRNDLLRKMRRNLDINHSGSQLITLIRNIAMSDSNSDRLRLIQDTRELMKESRSSMVTLIPQNKISDQLIGLLELCICDSFTTEKFMSVAVDVMIDILQTNTRRNVDVLAIVDYCIRLFMKMFNLKIEQYDTQILKMMLLVLKKSDDTILSNFSENQEPFMKGWECFFETLCYPSCLDDCVRILVKVYPHMKESVTKRFSDITDILVGWFISTDSKLETMVSLREVSTLLNPCWMSDCRNLEKILNHLFKDIVAECQKMSRKHRLDKERSDIEEMKLRLKHFCWGVSGITAGITRLKDHQIPLDDAESIAKIRELPGISDQFIVDLIQKIVSSFISCVKQIDFDNLLLQVNTILIHLLYLLKASHSSALIKSSQLIQTIVNYICVTFNPNFHRSLPDSYVISYQNFTFYHSFLILYGLCFDLTENGESQLIQQFFNPKSPLHFLLLYSCNGFNNEFNRCVIRIVDGFINRPVVVGFYNLLLCDLEISMNSLLKHVSLPPVKLIHENSFKNKQYDVRQAILMARYNIEMIMYLYNHMDEHKKAKLVPQIPSLLIKHLGCFDDKFITNFSQLSCFIYDSMLKIDYLTIDLIEDLLYYGKCFIQHHSSEYETRKVRFEYVDQLYWENIEYFCENGGLKIQLFMAYLDLFNVTLINNDLRLSKKIMEICYIFCKEIPSHLFTDVLREKIRDIVLNNCFNMVPEIQHTSYMIYYHMKFYTDPHLNHVAFDEQVTLIQSQIREGKNLHFPNELSKNIFNWIVTCTEEESEHDKRRLYTLLGHFNPNGNRMLVNTDICIIYELILNACFDCIQQKLKFDTSLESKTTLLTIENIIKFFISNGMTLRNFNDSRFQQLVSDFFSKEYLDQSKSINLLLLLLDIMEKLFYNAYQGCYKSFPGVNKTIETFFITNRQVCTDWFLKIRLMIMALSQYSNQWSLVIQQGTRLLTHYKDERKQLCQEIEDCVVLTAMAFAKLGNWESLLGLHHLTVKMYGDKFQYLRLMADKVLGKLEQSVLGFEQYIAKYYDPATKTQAGIKLLQRQTYTQSSFVLVMEEIADCHALLNNDEELVSWGAKIESWKKVQMLEAKKSNTKWSRLSVLAKLSKWTTDDECTVKRTDVHTTNTEFSWRYRSFIDKCDNQIYNQLFEPSDNALDTIRKDVAKIAAVQNICDYPNSFVNPDLLQLNEKLYLLSDCVLKSDSTHPPTFQFERVFRNPSNLMPLSVTNFYNAVLRQHRDLIQDQYENREFLLKWHRKRANFFESQNIISRSFNVFLNQPNYATSRVNLLDSFNPEIQIKLELEHAKLAWSTGKKLSALKLLVTSLNDSLFFETGDEKVISLKCCHNTKSLLTLFKWLNSDPHNLDTYFQDKQIVSSLKLFIELAEVPWIQGLPILSPQQRMKHFQNNTGASAYSDQSLSTSSLKEICGQLLMLASKSKNQTPHNKGFITLAQWCLDRSKTIDQHGFNDSNKLCELSSELEKSAQLTKESIETVKCIFMKLFQTNKMDNEQAWFGISYDDPEFIQQLIEQIRQKVPAISEDCCIKVCDVWKNTIKQHFSLHKASADAYFSFLKDSTTIDTSISYINQKRTANLRVLSLLNKRSNYLRQNLIQKIRLSQSNCWQTIEPQLFARLKHPDQNIRECMVDLLRRLALSATNINELVIYPTLVGCCDDSNNHADSDTIKHAYFEIKKSISDTSPQLVSYVDVFIHELRRITVLWDELWISSLGQCYDELQKKSQQFQKEIEHIDENYRDEDEEKRNVLIQISYNSTIQTASYILERIFSITNSRSPETPRERLFYNEFKEKIASTIAELKEPPSIRNFKQIWKRIKELQDEIISFVNKTIMKVKVKHGRHQYLSLKLSQISPNLSQISKNQVPLPGYDVQSKRELLSINEDIIIYPTKTKPKFLKLYTSTGETCEYLYKGMEDLRLDERIMQILDLINSMFLKINQRESTNNYQIVTYPVTPIGPRAGLIEMIKDCTSLFALYKHSQLRNTSTPHFDTTSKMKLPQPPHNLTNNATIVSDEYHQVIRPVDIYWQKLQPKLDQFNAGDSSAAAGTGIMVERDKLPHSLLIEVLNELRAETPRNLLSNELWSCSINSNNWWRSCIKFQRFSAIMSIIGHVIGLGDRHLDNLLVNLSNGRLVHIDFNICFDKGLSLKVPEKVPFRLTDIIMDVFGPIGVEGIYKNTCNNVYKIIRETRDNILTLMDTFVLDPIIDWHTGIETGHFGSFEGGKYALCNSQTQLEKRLVEFRINLYNFQYSLLTYSSGDINEIHSVLTTQFVQFSDKLTCQSKLLSETTVIRANITKKRELIEYMTDFDDDYQKELLDNCTFINAISEKQENFQEDLTKRLGQLQTIVDGHTATFKKLSIPQDFLHFKNEFTNLTNSISEFKKDKSEELALVVDQIAAELMNYAQDFSLIEQYRDLLQEMPHDFFIHNRCNEALIFMKKIEQVGKSDTEYIAQIISEYQHNWVVSPESTEDVLPMQHELKNWLSIYDYLSHLKSEIDPSLEEQKQHRDQEFLELEAIWSLICNENYQGINVFKSVVLEQYYLLAKLTTEYDFNIINKLPEKLDLSVDYNANIRNYIVLTTIHDQLLKCYTNYCSVFGISMMNNSETIGVFTSLTLLHKMCTNLTLMEKNFHEIIIPESVKIMKLLPPTQFHQIELVSQLNSINSQTDSVLLHFKTALTSDSYDIKAYDNVHDNVVKTIRQKLEKMINLQNFPEEFEYQKQLRILIASFFNILLQTYTTITEFIDFVLQVQIPGSWSYVDLLGQNTGHISPIWTKSIVLMKDTLYIHMVRILCNYVAKVHTLVEDISSAPLSDCSSLYTDFSYYLEVYFHFVNRHILKGIASACFSKVYCVFLEFSGWNIDQILTENLIANQCINTELLTNTVITYRRNEYSNAFNFMSQLQHRLTEFKHFCGLNNSNSSTATGAATTRDDSPSRKLMARNSDFVNSLLRLARNQIKVVSWNNKHLLLSQQLSESAVHEEIKLLVDFNKNLAQLTMRLTENKRPIFDMLDNLLGLLDNDSEKINKTTIILDTIRRDVTEVHDYLINIDRFECFRTKNSEMGVKFDTEMISFLSNTQHLFEQSSRINNLIKPIETKIVQLKSEFNIPDSHGWIGELIGRLELDIEESARKVGENEKEIIIFTEQFPSHKELLTKTLTHHFHPLLSHLKTSFKALNSSVTKIHSYENLDVLEQCEPLRQSYCTMVHLLSFLENFNSQVDAITSLLSHQTESSHGERIPELHCLTTTLTYTTLPNLFHLLLHISANLLNKLDNNQDDDSDRLSSLITTNIRGMLDALCHRDKKPEHHNPKTVSSHSLAVSKAIDNWCLVESRINLSNSTDKETDNITSSIDDEEDESIKDYVDKLIKCARNPDNLSRMYEGWTAWV